MYDLIEFKVHKVSWKNQRAEWGNHVELESVRITKLVSKISKKILNVTHLNEEMKNSTQLTSGIKIHENVKTSTLQCAKLSNDFESYRGFLRETLNQADRCLSHINNHTAPERVSLVASSIFQIHADLLIMAPKLVLEIVTIMRNDAQRHRSDVTLEISVDGVNLSLRAIYQNCTVFEDTQTESIRGHVLSVDDATCSAIILTAKKQKICLNFDDKTVRDVILIAQLNNETLIAQYRSFRRWSQGKTVCVGGRIVECEAMPELV